MAKYRILNNGVIQEYDKYEDIPEQFDNLISFEPDFPEPPHTPEQHEEISKYNDQLKVLMTRERK